MVAPRKAASDSGAARDLILMNSQVDVRRVLSTVTVPTLVLHRTGDIDSRVEEGRYIAGRIPGARASSSWSVTITSVCRRGPGRRRVGGVPYGNEARSACRQCADDAASHRHRRLDAARAGAGRPSLATAPRLAPRSRPPGTPFSRPRARHGWRRLVRDPTARRAPYEQAARSATACDRSASRFAPASTPANANSSTEQYAASPCTRPHGSWRKRAPGQVLASTVRDLVAGSGIEFAEAGSRLKGSASGSSTKPSPPESPTPHDGVVTWPGTRPHDGWTPLDCATFAGPSTPEVRHRQVERTTERVMATAAKRPERQAERGGDFNDGPPSDQRAIPGASAPCKGAARGPGGSAA